MCRRLSFFVSFVLVFALVGNASALNYATRDIGSVGLAGNTSEIAGTWFVNGSGADIWGNGDELHYAFRPLEGNGVLAARLVSMDVTDNWAKCGLMIRETLEPGSKHATMVMSGVNGTQFVYRETTGGGSAGPGTALQAPPNEMVIERDGDTLRGTFWNRIIVGLFEEWQTDSINIPMNSQVYIGLAVCSHNNTLLCQAVFDDPNGSMIWPVYNKAWMLSPQDGAAGVDLQPTLSWTAGDNAVSHDVRLGTNPAALPTVDTKPLGDESYTPPAPLAEGTVYYWRIVEQPGNHEGPVLSFTTFAPPTGIAREIWEGISGSLDDFKNNANYPCCPTWSDKVSVMDSPDLGIDNYGGRMEGLLWPETSGDYTFWIASDDASELLLSSDDNPDNLVKICEVSGWTGYHNYDAPEQMSAPQTLVGGQRYFIRALWKEGGGGDHCSVAWQGPDAPARTEITDYYFPLASLQAGNPNPADGTPMTVEEAAITSLSWSSKRGATSYDVYFGEEGGSMALIASGLGTSAAIPAVEKGKTYNWKVDIVYGTEVVEGDVWSLSIAAEWVSIDIQTSGGSATQDGDCWTIMADGGDIWDTADSFHFVYKTPTFTRDTGTLTARVNSVLNVGNSWAKAGVMIRETTAANSKNACTLMTPPDGEMRVSQQWRDSTGGGSDSLHYQTVLTPEWVRLTREGNVYKGYHSEDGVNWTQVTTHTTNMNSFVRVGLAVTSHNNGVLTTAEICDFTITTPDPRQSWGPSPGNGEENVGLDVTVSFGAGEDADEHRLYISESYEDVLYGLVAPIILPAGTTEYHLGMLNLGKVYYWVVDEARQEGREWPVTFGDVWSFKVENFRVIDDFEYCIETEPLPDQVEVPGEVVVEAVPPPDNTVIVDGYTIPGYTIEAIAPDDSNLVAHYEFEGNADDSTANANHGTVYGDPAYVAGPVGDAIACDATDDYNDYAIVADSPSLSFGTGSFSIGCWVKSSWTGGDKEFIVKNGSAGSEFGGKPPDGPNSGKRYVLKFDNEFRFAIDDNVTKEVCKTDESNIATGDWVQVTAVRNRADDKMYIYADGVLVGEQGDDTETSIDSPGEIMTIAAAQKENGTYAGEIGHWFNGQLDDMRFYNIALTEGNARFLAGVGDFVIPDVVVPPVYGPLLIHYAFDDGAGDVATDSSGNNNHGAISSAAWTAATADGSAASLDFEGGSNVVNNDIGYLMNGLSAMTISLWIQSDDVTTDQGFLIFADPAGNDERGMRYDKAGASAGGTNVIKYGVTTDVASDQSESSNNVQTTSWQHILITWDSSVGTKLYINGILDTPGYDDTDVGGVLTAYNKMIVGKGGKDGASDKSWDGRIDDVRIYNYIVTEGERRYLAGIGDILAPTTLQPLLAEYLVELPDPTADTSGNDYHGTPMGDVTIVDDAVRGYVASFDGDGDAVNIGNSPWFNFGYSDFSISAWINMSSYGNNWANCIVGKRGEGGQGWQLRRLADTQRISFTTRSCGDQDGWGPGGQNVSLNEWHHVAAVRQGLQKWLYIDGVKEALSDICDYVQPCDHDVYIGARANGGNTGPEAFFNGMIDELRIYNTALSYEQILNFIGCDNESIGDNWYGLLGAIPALDYVPDNLPANQSMRLEYCRPGVVKRITPFTDFSSGKAKALTMWVKGDPMNTSGQLFAELASASASYVDAKVRYDGDLTDPEWREWNIALEEFEGIPLSNVKWIAVGVFGASDCGAMRVDDMRLYPSRCVPTLSSITDLNQDCVVNGKDLRILAGDYLMGDSTVYAETPDAEALLASYQFEGNYDDSSGNGNNGTPVGAGITIETDPTMGQVLSLPGGDNVFVDCNGVGISGAMPRSIACWAKADNTSIPDWTLIFGFTTTGGGTNTHFNIGSLGGPGGVGAHVWGWEATIFSDTEALDWRHYAMTYDGDLLDYYGDGMLIGTVSRGALVNADNVYIGSRITQASSFPGKVDDARIYNYDLSWGEILTLAGKTEMYLPLESIANIYDEEPVNSKKVNLNDYALIGNDWLFEIVWP